MSGTMRALASWAALLAMTLASFETIAFALGRAQVLILVIGIAALKCFLIGREFMGLRHAHYAIRAAVYGWLTLIGAALCLIFISPDGS